MKKLLILLMLFSGCTCRIKTPPAVQRTPELAQVSIYRHPMELRILTPGNNKDVLVIYATGDGGWRGLDRQIFEWISGWGYPVVGFSSKSYLKNLEYVRNTTTPSRLVRDYEKIIQFAERKLGIPQSTRIVLVGLSRGAGLAIVAAGQGGLKSNLGGVVAVALTKEEEHVVTYRRRGRSQPNQPKRELLTIETYQYLPRIDTAPVVVIQSTHDSYLPADRARDLFGPDTDMRKLVPIAAKNHRFTGGCDSLYQEIEDALAWVLNPKSGAPTNP